MRVTKRDGTTEPVSFDKILQRLSRLADGLTVDSIAIAQKTVAGVRDKILTSELDELAAQTAAGMISTHPDYGIFASRIAVSNLHKNVPACFAVVVRQLHQYVRDGEPAPLVTAELAEAAERHAERIDAAIQHERDYLYDYFGFKTLERSSLLRIDDRTAERPQHMLMRVAMSVHADDIEAALGAYGNMAQGLYTHASPTLFNAGTPRPSLSSCYLLTMHDSIEGMFDKISECALVSKGAGGIGISLHDVRAAGSYIRGTNGLSNGLVPLIRVLDTTGRLVDQGGGKRKGAIAVYLEPWHADVFAFLDLRKNRGAEELRARDIFLGLWVPDLFMRRVEADADWSLFCPNRTRGLADVHGPDFDELYERYEAEGRAVRAVKARDLWAAILDAQIETGVPYMLYKDACNKHSNQKNLGTIRSSNLCTEIIEYTSKDHTSVCNLASIAVNRFVKQRPGSSDPPPPGGLAGSLRAGWRFYDFEHLRQIAKEVTFALNKVIERTHYPSENARRANLQDRPIGIGIQGLADAFVLLGTPYDSPEAAKLNRNVFECIYFAALEASAELAEREGPYASYEGSPLSQGILHFDSFGGAQPDPDLGLDWAGLRARIQKSGVRNSLLLAPMPTASTAQILGNNESFEAFTSMLYVRRVLSGEFVLLNKHLLADLEALGLWTPELKNALMAADGSVQGLPGIPGSLKDIYRTAWEIKGKTYVDMAADRQAFIDQSQSLNVFMDHPTHARLTSYHFFAWKRGLKTGSYYLRTKPAAQAIKFTVDAQMLAATHTGGGNSSSSSGNVALEAAATAPPPVPAPALACSRDNPDCIACSS